MIGVAMQNNSNLDPSISVEPYRLSAIPPPKLLSLENDLYSVNFQWFGSFGASNFMLHRSLDNVTFPKFNVLNDLDDRRFSDLDFPEIRTCPTTYYYRIVASSAEKSSGKKISSYLYFSVIMDATADYQPESCENVLTSSTIVGTSSFSSGPVSGSSSTVYVTLLSVGLVLLATSIVMIHKSSRKKSQLSKSVEISKVKSPKSTLNQLKVRKPEPEYISTSITVTALVINRAIIRSKGM